MSSSAVINVLGQQPPCLPESNCLAHIYSSHVVCSAHLGSLSFGSGVGPGLVGQPCVSFSHELSVQLGMEPPPLSTRLYEVLRSQIKFRVVSREGTPGFPLHRCHSFWEFTEKVWSPRLWAVRSWGWSLTLKLPPTSGVFPWAWPSAGNRTVKYSRLQVSLLQRKESGNRSSHKNIPQKLAWNSLSI